MTQDQLDRVTRRAKDAKKSAGTCRTDNISFRKAHSDEFINSKFSQRS